MAMGSAFVLAFRGRANWEPSVEEIPNAPQRVAGVLSAVIIATIWGTLGDEKYLAVLRQLAIGAGITAVISLVMYLYLLAAYTYRKVITNSETNVDEKNIIGGLWLSKESREVLAQRKKRGEPSLNEQELYAASGYDANRVWSRSSRAFAKVFCVVFYLLLIVAGTVSLGTTAVLVDVKISQSSDAQSTTESS